MNHISKTMNRTKKVIYAKKRALGQSQPSLQIWSLLQNIEFLGTQNAPFECSWRPNAI